MAKKRPKRAEASAKSDRQVAAPHEPRLADDQANMNRLQQVSTRLVPPGEMTPLLLEILDTAIAITAADMGNIQLIDPLSAQLRIVAQRGFDKPFLEFFNAVHEGQAACGMALQSGDRVVIEDVATSPLFAGVPERDALLAADVRAVQSTPLVSRTGQMVGMLSTHYRTPCRPADRDLSVIDLLARQAADWIVRSRDEVALRESEQRFRLMADAAPVLIWISGTDKGGIWFNKSWLDFVGRPTELELGNGWAENVHPHDYDSCLETYFTAFDARQPFRMEYRLRRHDGDYRWILDNGVPLQGAGGEFMGYIGSCTDITERKQAEDKLCRLTEELHAKVEELTTLLDILPGGVLIADPLCERIRANRAFYDMIGLQPGGNVSLTAENSDLPSGIRLYHEGHELRSGEFPMQVTGLTARRIVDFDHDLVFPDGRVVTLLASTAPVLDDHGAVRGVVGAYVDITARKRDQQALRESEGRLKAILNTAVDAIVSIDAGGTILALNPAAEQMFGYSSAEMIGQNVKLLMPSPFREEHDRYLANYLATGARHMIGIGREVQGQRKDGSIFPADLAVSEVESKMLFTGVIRDITRRKQLEREVLDIATLEQRRIGEELHDDIGQNLTGLCMLAEALAQYLATDGSPRQDAAAQLAAGLGQLRQQAQRFSRSLVPADVHRANLRQALQNLVSRTGELAGVACTLDCPDDILLPDDTTATHLLRIAQEAINNALRHGHAKHLHLRFHLQEQSVVLSIRDDGIGIPLKHHDSRGIGIRLMHNRAGIIGGKLEISPAPGGGTLVSCSVPKRPSHG